MMKIRGPLATLGAVAVLGTGIWLVNMSHEGATGGAAPVESPVTAAPAPTAETTSSNPVPAFPAKAAYVGKIPTRDGSLTLDITVAGDKAIAYACDGSNVEAWLSGRADNGALTAASKNGSRRLEGRLQGDGVVGTLWIDQQSWEFTAAAVQPPAGLYVYEDAGVRATWIIDGNGAVTGLRREPDGSTSPAPELSLAGIAVIDDRRITAIRVEGDDDI
jgi:hypothetical protein